MTAPRVLSYKQGDTVFGNVKIDFIYGHSPNVIVFKAADGKVYYETSGDVLTPTQALANRYFDRLNNRLICLPKGSRGAMREEIALAFFQALGAPDEANAIQHFEAPAARLVYEVQTQARYAYVGTGIIATLIAIALGAIATSVVSSLWPLAIGAGAFGACISVWLRGSRLELGPFETPANFRFQGATRILIGGGFGLMAYAAIAAGYLFPGTATKPWGIILITCVAGFSERLIPDLISRLESRAAAEALNLPAAPVVKLPAAGA